MDYMACDLYFPVVALFPDNILYLPSKEDWSVYKGLHSRTKSCENLASFHIDGPEGEAALWTAQTRSDL